jgi:hypothetical protein
MNESVQHGILRILLNDVAHFELILKDLNHSLQREAKPITLQELADAMRELITAGLAEAYLLPLQPPHFVKVEFSPARLDELWFQLTHDGEKAARKLTTDN